MAVDGFGGDDHDPVSAAEIPPEEQTLVVGDLVELCVRGAELVVTMDGDRREVRGGWVAISNGRSPPWANRAMNRRPSG